MSESPAESLKPDTEQLNEEITRCTSIIGKMDAIIKSREEEISNLKSSLASRDEIISEATEQIERLESDLASEQSKPIAIGAELPEFEPGNLLNQLKGKRKKSKADLADIEAILEILDK